MDAVIERPPVIETRIAEYSPTAAALAELRQRLGGVAYDLATTKGDREARADRLELVKLRTSLETKRKKLKAPALERSRLIDDEAKRITAAILDLETPIDEQIKAAEAAKEAERQAKIEAERNRVAAIRQRIDDIASVARRVAGKSVAEIEGKIELLVGLTIGESFAELRPEAERVRIETLLHVREVHATAVEQAAEAARLAAERVELDRQRAEQAEHARVERERIEAEAKTQREKIERDQAQALERQEQADRVARLAREEEDRKAIAHRAEADRKANEARWAEDERIRTEQNRLAEQVAALREQTERELQEAADRKQEQEDAEREQLEAEGQRLRMLAEGAPALLEAAKDALQTLTACAKVLEKRKESWLHTAIANSMGKLRVAIDGAAVEE